VHADAVGTSALDRERQVDAAGQGDAQRIAQQDLAQAELIGPIEQGFQFGRGSGVGEDDQQVGAPQAMQAVGQ